MVLLKVDIDYTAKGSMMTLRPGIDELIEKLKTAKNNEKKLEAAGKLEGEYKTHIKEKPKAK